MPVKVPATDDPPYTFGKKMNPGGRKAPPSPLSENSRGAAALTFCPPMQALAEEFHSVSQFTELQRTNFIGHSESVSLLALARDLGWCEDWSCCLVQSGGDLVDVVQTDHGEDEASGDTDSMDESRCKKSQQEAEENLREDLCLESFAKDKILQIIEGSEGEDEKAGAKQAPLDGEPLGGGQLAAVHLHPSEEQQGQEGRQRQRGARTHYWRG